MDASACACAFAKKNPPPFEFVTRRHADGRLAVAALGERWSPAERCPGQPVLAEHAAHFGDLGLLIGDDRLGELLGIGVGSVAQLRGGHVDGPGVVVDHHL
jgi:hypothetical protein